VLSTDIIRLPPGEIPCIGVPIESISSILGHKSIRTPQIYSKVIKAKVSEDMDKLKRKLSLLVATFLAVFRNITYQLYFQKSQKDPRYNYRESSN